MNVHGHVDRIYEIKELQTFYSFCSRFLFRCAEIMFSHIELPLPLKNTKEETEVAEVAGGRGGSRWVNNRKILFSSARSSK